MTHALFVALAVVGAAPEQLQPATAALDDLQFERALALLPEESAIKEYTREDVVTWLSTRALAQLGLKQDAAAAQTFRRLFSIDPGWVLSDQFGPRAQTLAATERAQAEKGGVLGLRFEAGLLRVKLDPFGYGTELRIFWREPEGPTRTATIPALEQQVAPWPRDQRLLVWGQILGLQGSTLLAWGSEAAPIRVEPLRVVNVAAPPVVSDRGRLGALSAIGLGAGAAALLSGGLGIGFALASGDAQRAQNEALRDTEGRITSLTQREAFAIDQRARGDAGAATAFFVTSAALVAVGAGLVLFDQLRVAPGANGASLVVPLDATFGLARVEARR